MYPSLPKALYSFPSKSIGFINQCCCKARFAAAPMYQINLEMIYDSVTFSKFNINSRNLCVLSVATVIVYHISQKHYNKRVHTIEIETYIIPPLMSDSRETRREFHLVSFPPHVAMGGKNIQNSTPMSSL